MSKMYTSICKRLFLCCLISICMAKKHNMDIKSDSRPYFPISTFGFYRYGYLAVNVSRFTITPMPDKNELFGFSLEKTFNPYTDSHPDHCQLQHLQLTHDALVQRVLFVFNTSADRVVVRCSDDMKDLRIYEDLRQVESLVEQSRLLNKVADTVLFNSKQKRWVSDVGRHKRQTGEEKGGQGIVDEPPSSNDANAEGTGSLAVTVAGVTATMEVGAVHSSKAKPLQAVVKCNDIRLPMNVKNGSYHFSFVVVVSNENEEGLYNLNFHNCRNYNPLKPRAAIDMTLKIVELNPDDNYLSAGEIPLPALYFMMALLFMLSAGFWFFILRKSKDPVFKIHYLMGVLVVIKSLSLLFHSINYHFIQILGTHMEAWAVVFYFMHLLKGALLFTVLALIGSGWAFVKHILSSKEKKIFIIVIPLQIIANVASIIIEETDEWDPEQAVWARLLFLVDFLCCAAILLPVVWSIRHLQEASQTDGKAAMNLSKLKLFRHFYIMVVCYIYFTRIIVYLLRITVPFQYKWLHDMFREMATYVFFVLTGYKFRPANNNPYFLLAYNEDDEDVVLTKTGLTQNISRVNQDLSGTRGGKTTRVNITREDSDGAFQDGVHEDDNEVNLLLPAKEDSHDLD